MKKLFLAALFFLSLNACKKDIRIAIDYRQEMRNFVQGISTYARTLSPNFIIIPQNGHNLISKNGEASGPIDNNYIQAINGLGREDLFYGYNSDDEETPNEETIDMVSFLKVAHNNGLQILVTDYCSTYPKMDNSYTRNFNEGFIAFAADHRELDNIPTYPSSPFHVNSNNINQLSDAKNFLYLINTANYDSKQSFINSVAATNYDVIIMDLNFNDEFFNADEINTLKYKAIGGARKIICYMSIGEAEDYRYYWHNFFKGVPPPWLLSENPQWVGNYKVSYWDKSWQNIIYGNQHSYTKRIIDAGFDGVYLDIIDAFEYFEN